MSESITYGLHAVKALLANQNRVIHKLYINEGRQDKKMNELLSLAKARQIPILMTSMQEMKKKFADINHQGIVAVTDGLSEYHEKDIPRLLSDIQDSNPLILVLDGVTDPHNLGACLRTADASGVSFVVVPKDKNVGLTPVVQKVASGACEHIPMIRVTNLVRTLNILKDAGVWVYGAAGEAEQDLYAIDLKGPVALVMGAEGAGMRRLTREHCDGLFSLPMQGIVSSLNVSVACGVSLYEAVRQRQAS